MKKQEAIIKVKEKLWKFGYSVKDFSDIDAIKFDLIVEGKFKVTIVKEFPLNWENEDDVFVKVDERIAFVKKSGNDMVMAKSPYMIFGRKKIIKKQSHETITKR